MMFLAIMGLMLSAVTPLETARELLVEDFAALNRGESTLVSVGDRAMELADATLDVELAAVLRRGAERIYDRACARLDLGAYGELDFVKCPTGAVDLALNWRNGKTVRVSVTRLYWIMRYPLTRLQSELYPPLEPAPSSLSERQLRDYVCLNHRQAEELCRSFTNQLRSQLPAGYEVRLPTLAEWERAYHAEAKAGEPFADLLHIHQQDEVHRLICYDGDRGDEPKSKLKNAWGIGDWCGQEKVWDTFDPATLEREVPKEPNGHFIVRQLPESSVCENPAYVCRGPTRVSLVRMPFWARWKASPDGFERDWSPLRLVIGPILK